MDSQISLFDDGSSKSSIFTHQFLENGGFTSRVHKLTHWNINEIPQNASFYGRFFEKIHYQKFSKNLADSFWKPVSFVSLYCSFFNESIRIHAFVGWPNITRPRPHNMRLISSSSRPCRAVTSSSSCPKFEIYLVLVPSWGRPSMRTVPGRLVPSYGSLFGSWNTGNVTVNWGKNYDSTGFKTLTVIEYYK